VPAQFMKKLKVRYTAIMDDQHIHTEFRTLRYGSGIRG
jgi:hypothetical protein